MAPSERPTIYQHAPSVVATSVAGTVVLVAVTAPLGDLSADVFRLNDTAAAVWNALDGSSRLNQVAAGLSLRFATDVGRVSRDAESLVAHWLELGLIAEAEGD